ncbi:hypothetical protein ASG56_05760 [Rhodococcus sp. Leaf7]|nr:hypothetical protein ASG56_05760 [Rhodococcus sp. Leaf7]KQU42578.1 hypothetical protein ASG64_05760 [Rhodococcus sp. Leaf247]
MSAHQKININKRGLLVWPTTGEMVTFEPNREISYRITENGMVWGFEITPTTGGVTLTEPRVAANGETVSAVTRLPVNGISAACPDATGRYNARVGGTG